jgi:hypothetical protein
VLDVGGAKVVIALPAGWCVYPEPLQSTLKGNFTSVSPENVPLLYFGDCAQIQLNLRNGTRIRDFGLVAIPRVALTANAGTNRARALDQIAATMTRHDGERALTSQRDRINKADMGITVGEVRPLGLLGRDASGVYVGLLQRFRTDQDDVRQMIIYATTVLSRRMISYYMYGDHRDERSLQALLTKAQAELARTVASN